MTKANIKSSISTCEEQQSSSLNEDFVILKHTGIVRSRKVKISALDGFFSNMLSDVLFNWIKC